jgi:hypothetical protein
MTRYRNGRVCSDDSRRTDTAPAANFELLLLITKAALSCRIERASGGAGTEHQGLGSPRAIDRYEGPSSDLHTR